MNNYVVWLALRQTDEKLLFESKIQVQVLQLSGLRC